MLFLNKYLLLKYFLFENCFVFRNSKDSYVHAYWKIAPGKSMEGSKEGHLFFSYLLIESYS